jgi:UTP-glucose-1-phosphate uridylyltransferase
VELSRSEIQSLALARCFYYQPKLLILDEPRSFLDNAMVQQLVKNLDEWKKAGVGIIFVSNSPQMMKLADYVVELKDGVIHDAFENKPLIEYGVEEAIQAGMTDMCVVTGRGKHSLMDHFDKNYELEHQISGTNKEELLIDIREIIDAANFTYIRQREMKGLGHAILTGHDLVGDEPFAVVLADDLCVNRAQGVLAQKVTLYKQFRCSIVAVEEVPVEETHKYGVISSEMIKDKLYRVDDMVEKPDPGTAPSNLAIIGRYIPK